MGQTRFTSKNVLTDNQNQALDAILKQSTQSTNFLSEYLKNLVTQGPSSQRAQQAVTSYKEQILPQLISQYGGGKSSSALNQALSTGAQSLAQNVSSDTMSALQMLLNLTQSQTSQGLGTRAQEFQSAPSTGTQALSALLQLLGIGGNLAGQFWGK